MKKITLTILFFILSSQAWATIYYVRDGGSNKTNCTGTTNAVYPGSGTAQNCAFSNPKFVLGVGCGNYNQGGGGCDVAPLIHGGDTVNINGDSDTSPGQQAQYMIGYDATGVTTPTNSSHCSTSNAYDCTMGGLPSGASGAPTTVQTTAGSTHQAQLWGNEGVDQVLLADANFIVLNNLEITQHSACTYLIQGSGTVDGFPLQCHGHGNGYPFGPYGIGGVFYGGSNDTIENMYVHGMSQFGMESDSLATYLSLNNVIAGNGEYGDALGQLESTGTATYSNLTFNNERAIFSGCAQHYPNHSSNPYDMANYHDCYDDANGGQGDGIGNEANSAVCTGNFIIENSDLSYNTKGGMDFLHCQSDGNFYIYRTRAEGNEGQSYKFNNANVYFENSQSIGDCYWYQNQTITYTGGNAPDLCRAAGDIIQMSTNVGGTWSFVNSTFLATSPSNIEYAGNCMGTVYWYNNNVIGGWNGFLFGNNALATWQDPECASGSQSVVEDYNHVWNTADPFRCAGAHDICNDTSAAVTGNLLSALGPSQFYQGQDLGHILYASPSGTLVAGANNAAPLQGTGNDLNNFSRGSSWTIGSYQVNSCVLSGNVCFEPTECCGGSSCTNNICASGSCTANGGSCSTGSTCCSGLCNSSQCVPFICGDGVMPEGSKVCDTTGPNLNGQTCISQGFAGGGTLGCNAGCLSFNTSACMGLPVTIVQHVPCVLNSNGTSLTCSISSTGANNLIVAQLNIGGSPFISSVTDSASNIYTQFSAASIPSNQQYTYYLSSSTAGTTSVTATFTGTAPSAEMEVWEVNGLNAPVPDVGNEITNGSSSGTTATGASVTTTGTYDFVAAFITGNITSNPQAGNNFTFGGDIVSNQGFVSLIASPGTYTPVWTRASSDSIYTVTGAFKSSGCTANGGACSSGSTCCSNLCSLSSCVACIATGNTCTINSNCCSNNCVASICSTAVPMSLLSGNSKISGNSNF